MRHARAQKAWVLAVTNTVGSTISRECDAAFYTRGGPEVAVASTKAVMTQITAMYLVGLYLAQLRGTRDPDEVRAHLQDLQAVPDLVQELLGRMEPVRELAHALKDEQRVLFLGRHVGYPMALEGALKLKELAYVSAEGFPAGEIKHGPIALVEDGTPVVVIAPRHALQAKLINNVQEVRARGARTIVLATDGDDSVTPYADARHPHPRHQVAADAAAHAGAPAGVLRRDRPCPRARRRPAEEPGEVGHRRVATWLIARSGLLPRGIRDETGCAEGVLGKAGCRCAPDEGALSCGRPSTSSSCPRPVPSPPSSRSSRPGASGADAPELLTGHVSTPRGPGRRDSERTAR